jgi:hypothetical protein
MRIGIKGQSQNHTFVARLSISVIRYLRQFPGLKPQPFFLESFDKKVAARQVVGVSAMRAGCSRNPIRNAPGGTPVHPNTPLKKRQS